MCKRIIFAFASVPLFFLCGHSQDVDIGGSEPKNIVTRPTCFAITSSLTDFSYQARSGETVFVISNTGRKERRIQGKRRLQTAKSFFSKGLPLNTRLDSNSIIIAESPDRGKDGRLDFWVGGSLELRIVFRKNQDLWVSPCVE